MIKALTIAAAATAAVIAPTAALAQLQSGTLAGYSGHAYDNGRLDVIQLNGPSGTISIAVDCHSEEWTWIGNSGDKPIVDRAVRQWCF